MIADIEFVQFLPNGRRKKVLIRRGGEVARKAQEIKAAGYRLECKAMVNGMVAVAIADDGADEIIASRLRKNDDAVPLAVDDMINEFHGWLSSAKQSSAGFVSQEK